jgi:hypothetical protein
MATKLYVGNLSFRTTSEDLREAFASAGTVESATVIEDRDTGRSRGFGLSKWQRQKKQPRRSNSSMARISAVVI